ncbi:MAG: hypothetical protein O3B01_05475 [Planctomycetota bacterium]|nr:hypothetical protein [Planctomycetota bacterium]
MLQGHLYSILTKLRANIRLYVFAEAASRILGGIALFCWLSLGIDFRTEMGPTFRGVILTGAMLGLFIFLAGSFIPRFFASLKLTQLALAIETMTPAIGGRLISALELEKSISEGDRTFSHALARQAMQSAEQAVSGVRPSHLLDYRRLYKIFSLCLGLAITWTVFVFAAPDSASIWFKRNIMLSAETEWPHETDLQIPGFEDGRILIARGDDFSVRVLAGGKRIPSKVQIRYWMMNSRSSGRAYLVKVGMKEEAGGRAAEFVHRFAGLLEPVEFEIRGGDDFEGPFVIETVPPPTLTELNIHCRYPSYTGLTDETLEANSLVYNLPHGTVLEFKGRTNKSLTQIRYTLGKASHEFTPQTEKEFSFGFPLVEDTNLGLILRDRHGIENREAAQMTLIARPDRAPEIDANLRGIRQSITPKAIIPFSGTIKDEYGIASADFQYKIDEGENLTRAIRLSSNQLKEVPLREPFDVLDLKLQPGQKLQLQVVASDGNTLTGPKDGSSKLFTFEIVTLDELLSQIGARELNLRRRFERALEELRESETDLEFIKTELKTETPDLSNLKLYSDRVLIGGRKNQNEVAGISQSFNDILLEIQNNRIENDELLKRLDQGICIPLNDISTNSFPVMLESVQALSTSLENQGAQMPIAEEASESARMLIAKMEKVLAAMLEMEDFNEAVELLRGILQLQKKIEEETKELRKKRIRELLK